MSRPRKYDLPDNLTLDSTKGRYRYFNPLNKKSTWLGTDKDIAITKANDFNLAIRLALQKRELDEGQPHQVKHVIDLFLASAIHDKPWDEGTRKNHKYKLTVLKEVYGNYHFLALDRIEIESFLKKRCTNGDTWNKWRYIFIMLYTFAISRKLADVNEAEAVLKKSTSKKLEYNQKARQPLTIDKFMKIVKHDSCEPFLRVAMNLSLVTLQARSECVNLKYTDIRDGYLYVIRDKTSGDSDMAFIRIKITDQIEEIISESRKDNIASPFTVHRAPKTRQRKHLDNKPHWTYVMPNYLSKAFKKALEASCPEYKGMGRSAPSFHEIRALGSKVYREMGYCKDQIRALMTHANEKTTDIYLNGGKLEDHHFIKVNAELNLSDLK